MSALSGRLSPELPYLEVFHTVCAEGGFTAAARRLECTQPAVSYQVRALERVLEARLVERGGRRVLLTPAGERVKAFCQQFFGELARVRQECASGHSREPLRLASASGFGRYVLVPALRALSAGPAAGLELHLAFDSADVVLRSLERGECEAAFVYTRRISNLLRYRAVYDEELVMIASPSFRRAMDARLLEHLSGFEQISFVTYQESDYVFGRWFDGNFGEQPAALRSVARFSELEEVIDLVRRDAGLSIVPRDAIEEARARGEVDVLYTGRGAPCLNQVFIVTRSGSVDRPEIQALIATLRSSARPAAGVSSSAARSRPGAPRAARKGRTR